MCKETLTELTDQWFFDNGYLTTSKDRDSCYSIVSGTQKFTLLFETCLRLTPKNQIITPEIVMKVINDNDMKRNKISNGYIRVTVEEKARRKALRQKIKAERKLKDATRQS